MRKDKYSIGIGDVFYYPVFKGFDDSKKEHSIVYVPNKYEIIDIYVEAYVSDIKPVFKVCENDIYVNTKYLGDIMHWYETEEECLKAIEEYSATGFYPSHTIENF